MTDEELYNEYRGSDCKSFTDFLINKIAELKAVRPEWHKLDWEKDFPDVDKLIRVRTCSGAEYICETYSYKPAEDEIGYGKLIINFYELNGEWVDDNDIIAWCELPTFDKE